jgi:hypothetical protein
MPSSNPEPVECPRCGSCSVALAGVGVIVWIRRLLGRNLYLCFQCQSCWHSRKWSASVPRLTSTRFHIVKKPS